MQIFYLLQTKVLSSNKVTIKSLARKKTKEFEFKKKRLDEKVASVLVYRFTRE